MPKQWLLVSWPTRRLVVVVLAIVVLAAAAVADAPGGVTQNDRIPFTFATQTCAGEDILLSGEMHIMFRETQDGADGSHGGGLTQVHATGVTASGRRYVDHSVNTGGFTVASGGVVTLHSTAVAHLIAVGGTQGPADDLRFREVFHVTWDPSGRQTSSHLEFFAECS